MRSRRTTSRLRPCSTSRLSLRSLTSIRSVLTMQVTMPVGRYDSIDARAALLRQMEERIAAIPGVETVGDIDFLPLSGQSNGFPYRLVGQQLPPGTSQVVSTRTVTPGFFRALRVPLRRGRMFGPDDRRITDTTTFGAMLINEAFAKQHWANESPLGARIVSAGGSPIGEVVGIVADMRQSSVDATPAPEIYLAASQWGWNNGAMLIRGTSTFPERDV